LIKEGPNYVKPDRLAIMTGLKTTGDNCDFLLTYVNSILSGDGKNTTVIAIEESYLITRLKATLRGRLQKTHAPIDQIILINSGASQWKHLKNMHKTSIISLFLMFEEVKRLKTYSNPKNDPFLFPFTFLEYSDFVEESFSQLENVQQKDFEELTQIISDKKKALQCIAP